MLTPGRPRALSPLPEQHLEHRARREVPALGGDPEVERDATAPLAVHSGAVAAGVLHRQAVVQGDGLAPTIQTPLGCRGRRLHEVQARRGVEDEAAVLPPQPAQGVQRGLSVRGGEHEALLLPDARRVEAEHEAGGVGAVEELGEATGRAPVRRGERAVEDLPLPPIEVRHDLAERVGPAKGVVRTRRPLQGHRQAPAEVVRDGDEAARERGVAPEEPGPFLDEPGAGLNAEELIFYAALRGVRRLFAPIAGRTILKATLGGIGIGVIALVAGEETLFSGEHELEVLLDHPEAYGAGTLLLILVGKVLALALSLETGFRGGRIFPVLFIGATVGFVTADVFERVPLAVAVGCGMAGAAVAIMRLPVFVAVLVAFFASPALIPLIVLASVVGYVLTFDRPELGGAPPEKEKMASRADLEPTTS